MLYDLCVSEICDLKVQFGQHPVISIFWSVHGRAYKEQKWLGKLAVFGTIYNKIDLKC